LIPSHLNVLYLSAVLCAYITEIDIVAIAKKHTRCRLDKGVLHRFDVGPITIERAGDSSRYFSGTVADAVVFGTALSASIIAQQYADLTSTALPSVSQSMFIG
jgi:hypothetical protein